MTGYGAPGNLEHTIVGLWESPHSCSINSKNHASDNPADHSVGNGDRIRLLVAQPFKRPACHVCVTLSTRRPDVPNVSIPRTPFVRISRSDIRLCHCSPLAEVDLS